MARRVPGGVISRGCQRQASSLGWGRGATQFSQEDVIGFN